MRKALKKIGDKLREPFIAILGITVGATLMYTALSLIQLKTEYTDTIQTVERLESKRLNEKKINADPVKEKSETGSDVITQAAEGQHVPSLGGIEKQIYETFKNDYKIALAVAKAESGLRSDAQGYNCRYGGISQACRIGDENKAWSTDCGVYQINVIGTTCPADLFNPAKNIEVAFQKYQKRGWQPWSAFNSGSYLKHISSL
jgi:hypothetical protein